MRMEDNRKTKILALLIVLAGKVVDKAQLNEFWEEVRRMGNQILEFAEEYGEKRGLKIGEERKGEEAAQKMVEKGYDILDILEVTGISPERLRKIIQDEAV